MIGRLLITLLLVGTANGAVLHVSKAGSNTAPYDTWAKAATHPNRLNDVVSAGDSIKIGAGVYDTTWILPPRGGTAKTIYCDSSDSRTATLSSGFALTGTWSVSSGSIYVYDATIARGPYYWEIESADWGCVTEDGRVLTMKSSTGAMTSAGTAYYNSSTDLLYVRTRGGGSPAGYAIRFSQNPAVNFLSDDQDSVYIHHLVFDMGVQSVISIGSSFSGGIPSYGEIRDCLVKNGGVAFGSQNQALIYCGNSGVVTDADPGKGWRFINDTLQYCTGDASGNSEHMGNGLDSYMLEESLCSALVVLDIDGTGINWKNGYSATVDEDNNVMMDCKFTNAFYGIRVGPHMDSTIIAGCQFNVTGVGIACFSSFGTQAASGRTRILNNTFYNTPTPVIIAPTATGNNSMMYNVVFDTTSRLYSVRFDVMGGEAPAQTPYVETFWQVDYNMYYGGADAFTCTFTDNNATCTGTNWTAWQGCGFDAHGLNTTNPNFANSAAPDLSRPSASGEMNQTYLGRTWTVYGAVQPTESGGTTPIRTRARIR